MRKTRPSMLGLKCRLRVILARILKSQIKKRIRFGPFGFWQERVVFLAVAVMVLRRPTLRSDAGNVRSNKAWGVNINIKVVHK
jgi:hypothetical protein